MIKLWKKFLISVEGLSKADGGIGHESIIGTSYYSSIGESKKSPDK